MPIGSYAAIPTIASQMILRHPKRILDLGMGFGMMGAAARQWIDLGVSPWRTYLVGVEVWASYRNPLWQLYDLVFLRSIEEHLALDQATYDMVVLGDVIEHFDDAIAQRVLQAALERVAPNGCCLVITPAVDMQQGAAHGNPYETHRSVWTAERLSSAGFDILLNEHDPQLPPAVPTVVAMRVK